MDAKLTLSFDATVIEQAKIYADKQGLSLSRLTEILLRKLIDDNPASLESYQVSDWVSMVAEGPATYKAQSSTNKQLRAAMRERKPK